MMRRRPVDPEEPEKPCPLTTAIEVLGGKWSFICLYWLAGQPRHFGALRRLMPGISHKVLTETLRHLERNDLITRSRRADAINHVDYALSDYGRAVIPLLEAMRQWGTTHIDLQPASG